jgi:hypothetical protein
LGFSRFKSVSIPEEDYTQYLRVRSLVQGASRRFLDILRSVNNYLDEDTRQEMGSWIWRRLFSRWQPISLRMFLIWMNICSRVLRGQ